MSSFVERARELSEAEPLERREPTYPKGWQPRSEIDDDGGFIVSEPYEDGQDLDQSALFELHEQDESKWTITKVRSSRWQQRARGEDPVWLKASKIEFEPAVRIEAAKVDVEKMIARVRKWRPRTPKTTTDRSFWSPVGDTQIGKIEGGGTTATEDRFLSEMHRVVHRQKEIQAATVWLPWLGDCIEGVVSQGGRVQGRTDLPITDQVAVVREMMLLQIKTFAPTTDRIEIVSIPGNHDEPSRDLFTEGTDSWAVDSLRAVRMAIRENPELVDKVGFHLPKRDTLTVTVDVQGKRIAMAHGHQFPNKQQYWQSWWDEQIRARTFPGEADILLAAHRHHLVISDFGGDRMFIQIPAMDGGSQHYDDRHGGGVPTRMVSFILDSGGIRNFDPVT